MGPEGSSVDVPGGPWTRESPGFGRVRERMWFSKEGGGGNFSILAVSCAVCTKLLCLANFLGRLGYQNLVPDISSRFCGRRANVGRKMFSPSYGLD